MLRRKRKYSFSQEYHGADLYLFYFLLALPIINAFADSTIYYFVDVDYEQGLHPGIIRGIILLIFIVLFGYRRIRFNTPSRVILVFLFYLFILTLFSSNVRHSFLSGYLKWFIPLMMYPVGIYFIRNYQELLVLNRVYVWGALIVCVNLIIAQFTGYGISAYVEESFFTGGAGVGITNQLALVLLTYPFLFRQRPNYSGGVRWLVYIVGFLSILFVVVAMKRAGILSLMVGMLIFLYLTQSKVKFLRYVIIAALLLYLIFPVFKTILAERYNARMEQMQHFEDEARYKEFFYVIREFRDGNIGQKLFGKELFNSGATFGQKYFHSHRIIHSDFSSFFYGSGLIGIILYLSVFLLLLREGVRYRRRFRRHDPVQELLAIYFSILPATFLISVSGSGTIGERCLSFLYLGAITGVTINILKQRAKSKNGINGSVPANIIREEGV